MTQKLKRYEIEYCSDADHEMVERANGDYVKFEDMTQTMKNHEMIIESLTEQNTALKTLLARRNNEIEQMKGNYRALNEELLGLRRKFTEMLTEGRFQEKVKTLVG